MKQRSSRLRICFVISNLTQGGAERQMVELIKGLDPESFEITLLLYAANKPIFYREIFELPHITVIEHHLASKAKLIKIAEAILYLRNYFARSRFDVLHTMLVMNGALLRVALWFSRHYRNRIVVSLRNAFEHYPRGELWIERLLLGRSVIVANTEDAAKKFAAFCPRRLQHRVLAIHNGYNVSRFCQRNHHANSSRILLGSVGRTEKRKNHIQVLRVLKDLPPVVNFEVIGNDGDAREELCAFAEQHGLDERVRLSKATVNIEEHYARFDVFVLPSLHEGCPNVLLEAMLSKCLCVVSSSANRDSIVEDGVRGLVYNGTDAHLKEKLTWAIQEVDQAGGTRLAEEALSFAGENYSLERMVSAYEDLYRRLPFSPDHNPITQTILSTKEHP